MCSGKLQVNHYFCNINFRRGSSLAIRLEREIKPQNEGHVNHVKELILYLADEGDSLKSFKQGRGMVSKEGYKQTE